MRKIIKLSGVTVDNDTLPRVVVSPEERALAGLPGLFMWMQAGNEHAVATSFRDRVTGGLITPRSSSNFFEQTTFANGAPAVQANPADSAANYLPPAGAGFDPNRWSVVAVVNAEFDTGRRELISLPTTGVAGELNVRLLWSTNGRLTLWEGGSTTNRLQVAGVNWGVDMILMMCTFSVENGINFFVNGVNVASNPTDKRPLDQTAFQIGSQGLEGAGGTGFRGKLGQLMLFNSDLSAMSNAGYRRVLESVLMDQYGIG